MNMFRILTLVCLATAFPLLASAQTTPVVTVKCIVSASCGTSSLQTAALAQAPIVLAQGYYAPGDGGGGEFYLQSTSACTAGTEDGGTIFSNTTSPAGCYYRRFTGTVYMSWFGAKNSTPSSLFDVSAACGAAPASCWTNAFKAAASATPSQHGNNTVSTGGLYLYTTGDISPLANQSFTCDAPNTGQADVSYAGGATGQVTGALLMGPNPLSGSPATHTAMVRVNASNTDFHHCVVLTTGLSATPITLDMTSATAPCNSSPPGSVATCAFANTRNMVKNADTGVYCDSAETATIHDVLVAGFDTGIAAHGCSRFKVENSRVDANVGIYLQNDKAPAFLNNINIFPFMSSGLTNDEKQITLPVSTIGGTTGGPCTITLTGTPVYWPDSTTGDWVSVAGDGNPADEGQLSCYGTFKATYPGSGTTITLQGSRYGDATHGAFVTRHGSWLANSSIINVNAADGGVAGVQAGQCVTSSDPNVFTGFSGGGTCGSNSVLVKDVSYASNKIVIEQVVSGAITNAQTQTAQPSTAGYTLSFTNPGSYVKNSLFHLYASPRVEAGYSIGGAGTGNVANCVAGGGPGDSSPLGIIANNIFCFGHRVQYNFNSVGPAVCTGCAFDTQSELFDISQIGVRFGHGTDPLILTGTRGGAIPGCSSPQGHCLGNININGSAVDPQLAGWNVGDVVIDSGSAIPISSPPQTVDHFNTSEFPSFAIYMSGNVSTATGVTLYDVRPLFDSATPPNQVFPTGTISSGAMNVIASLNADPNTNWRIGDQIITPRNTGILPYPGGRIVSMSNAGCMPNCSVTLDTNALATGSAIPLGDLSVSAPQSTSGADFVGANLGGGGGFVFDAPTVFCNSVQGTTIKVNNPGQPALESVSGCTQLTNVSTNQPNDLMVDAGTGNLLLSGSQFARGGLYFEGPDVASLFAGSGNLIGTNGMAGTGGQSNMVTFGDSSKCMPTSQSKVVVFCGGDGTLGNAGNAYAQCNPVYSSTLCVSTRVDHNGIWKQQNSAANPISEYNDATQASLPTPYHDNMQAKFRTAPARVLSSTQNVIATCAHTGCISGSTPDGVYLPATSGWIDASATPTGSPCFGWGGENCGVSGGITIVNTTGSPIQVWANSSSDKVNGQAATTGYQQTQLVQTYYPVSGVGWFSH